METTFTTTIQANSNITVFDDKFDALAPSKRKEFVRQVKNAKTQETRERRITKILYYLFFPSLNPSLNGSIL
jgi:uncharacterized protein YdeI (YjbR/CyaY-like superfamily)